MKVKQFEDFQLYIRDEKDWGFWQNDTFEPEETELIKRLLKPSDVCLDIGANLGYFTILMAKLAKKVFAFEANNDNCQLLKKNLLLNNIDNTVTFPFAVTNSPMNKVLLYICNVNNGMHRVYPSKFCDEAVSVFSMKIDNTKGFFDDTTFIKMDIEGSELGALKGMEKLLEKNRPTMIMEFHPPSIEESGANPKDIYDLLKSYYNQICLIPNIKEHFTYEELYLQTDDPSGGRNILCQNKN